MNTPSQASHNVAGIQFLRFVAAMLVVFRHANEMQFAMYREFTDTSLLYLTNMGSAGVHIFFVISGFVMAHTSWNAFGRAGATAKFWLRRFLRVYPTYWIFAAAYLACHTFFLLPYKVTLPTVAGALLLLPQYAGLVVGPAWTLSYEIYFYFIFGLVLFLPRRWGLLAIAAFFLGCVAIGLVTGLYKELGMIVVNPLLLEFLSGVGVAAFYRAGYRVPFAAAVAITALSLVLFAAGYGIDYRRLPTLLTWGFPGALLVFGFVGMETVGRLPVLVRKLSFLGNSSYSLYLSHILFFDIIMPPLASGPVTTHIVFLDLLVYMGLALVFGVLCYKVIELPITQKGKQVLLAA